MMTRSGTQLSGNFSLPCVAQPLHTNFIYSSVRTEESGFHQTTGRTLTPLFFLMLRLKPGPWAQPGVARALQRAVCPDRNTPAIFPSLQTHNIRASPADPKLQDLRATALCSRGSVHDHCSLKQHKPQDRSIIASTPPLGPHIHTTTHTWLLQRTACLVGSAFSHS